MIEFLSIKELIDNERERCIVDVRSPIEYKKGHIPKAINIPLFTNEERAIIGRAYKQESKERALELGLDFAKKKKPYYLDRFRNLKGNPIIHCWRGGMRSRKLAEFLEENGFQVGVLEKGYKAWRQKVQEEFARERKLLIIGGYTGTGKTDLLHYLEAKGHQIIDLEGLANHRGSAFGLLPEHVQPTTEQFENNLFEELRKKDINYPLFVEDESAFIGNVFVPHYFYQQMKHAPIIFLEVPKETRAKKLAIDYGNYPEDLLWSDILKIKKRFSKKDLEDAKSCLYNGQLEKTAVYCLSYYDKMYDKALNKKSKTKVYKLRCETTKSSDLWACLEQELIKRNYVRNKTYSI